METFSLEKIEKLDPVVVFTGGGVDPLLDAITAEVRTFVPDTTTDKGRKEIASLAYKVSQAKVRLDTAGKSLVEGWKQQAAKVDQVRKKIRDDLDALRDEARKPLTEWEAAEEERLAAAKLSAEILMAHSEALAMNDLFDREQEVKRKEAELARLAEEKRQQEESDRIERERAEREAQIAKEAAEKAAREEREKAEAERLRLENAEREAREAKERAEREAKEATERAERERIAAEERAKVEREMAEREADRRAKFAVEQAERERKEKEERERVEEERRQANKRHRAKIQLEVVTAIVGSGFNQAQALKLCELIDGGKIPHVKIEY